MIIINRQVPSPCFTPVSFTYFSLNARCQFTQLLNLCSLSYGLTPLRLAAFHYANPPIINEFLFDNFLIYAKFFRTQLGRKTRGECSKYFAIWNYRVYIFSVRWESKQSNQKTSEAKPVQRGYKKTVTNPSI